MAKLSPIAGGDVAFHFMDVAGEKNQNKTKTTKLIVKLLLTHQNRPLVTGRGHVLVISTELLMLV